MRDNTRAARDRIGYVEGYSSIAVNVVLFALKLWVGIATRSVAIIADAWHTLSDSITSIAVILGIKFAGMPADKKHPFGHGRAEIIASIFIGTLLAIVGFNFMVESIQRLLAREAVSYSRAAAVVFILSTVLKEGLAQFAVWGGKKYGSEALLADGWHHRSDAIASVLILAGFFAGKHLWWIDSAMGIAVSLLIFYATWEILHKSVSRLIGEQPDGEMVNCLREITCRIAGEQANLHHLHLHQYGDHREITFHINLPPDMLLAEAHGIATGLEDAIRTQCGYEATIHIDPVGEED